MNLVYKQACGGNLNTSSSILERSPVSSAANARKRRPLCGALVRMPPDDGLSGPKTLCLVASLERKIVVRSAPRRQLRSTYAGWPNAFPACPATKDLFEENLSLIPVAQRVDEQAKGRRGLAPAWIVEVVSRVRGVPLACPFELLKGPEMVSSSKLVIRHVCRGPRRRGLLAVKPHGLLGQVRTPRPCFIKKLDLQSLIVQRPPRRLCVGRPTGLQILVRDR
jgi:hypothetical protein